MCGTDTVGLSPHRGKQNYDAVCYGVARAPGFHWRGGLTPGLGVHFRLPELTGDCLSQ